MFIGHVGTGLALKGAEPRLNLGALLFASLLPDFLLGVFVLAGWEQVFVPGDYARRRYLLFRFPYSHSVAAALLWALASAGAASILLRGRNGRRRGAIVIGMAVILHYLGDVIEHPPQLTIAGEGSPHLGLGLWNRLGWALALETLLALSGLAIYLAATRGAGAARRAALAVLVFALTATAIAGQALSEVAAGPRTNALFWIASALLVTLAGWRLDRRPGGGP